ncbi:MAG: hypothetical protein EBS74_09585 [Flavobacteriia bacterium]|nr:hypothetical protein [Flavobacteriia bacterium]
MFVFDGDCFSDIKSVPESLLNAMLELPIHTQYLNAYQGKIALLESHYFSIMASLRRARVDVPMHFSLHFFQDQLETYNAVLGDHPNDQTLCIKFYRSQPPNKYKPITSLHFLLTVSETKWSTHESVPIVYKDHYIYANDNAKLFQTHELLRKQAEVFAFENGHDASLMLNHHKRLSESTLGAIFLIQGNLVKTPSLEEGVVATVSRNAIINFLKKEKIHSVEEGSLPLFALQQADELFFFSAQNGFTQVRSFRKKSYAKHQSSALKKAFLRDYRNQL